MSWLRARWARGLVGTTALLLGSAALTVTVADAAPLVTPKLTVYVNPTTVSYSLPVKVDARVTTDGVGLPGQRVKLVAQSSVGAPEVVVATVLTGSTGHLSWSFRAVKSQRLKLWVAATPSHTSVTSAWINVVVRPGIYDVTPGGASYAIAGKNKTVSGSMHGDLAGSLVQLEQLIAGRWTTVTDTRVRGDGTFDLTFIPASAGESSIRVVAAGGNGLVTRTTNAIALTTASSLGAFEELRPQCWGAAAIVATCQNTMLDGFIGPGVTEDELLNDSGGAYGCWVQNPSAPLNGCSYGPDRSDAVKIAIVGDSHAASYYPALAPNLTSNNIRLTTYVGLRCRWGDSPRPDAPDCTSRTNKLTSDLIKGDYDLIIVAHAWWRGDAPELVAADAASRSAEWRKVMEATSAKVVALKDAPYLPSSAPSCVTNETFTKKLVCAVKASSVYGAVDPQVPTVEQAGLRAHLVDLDEDGLFCKNGNCPLVTGHVAMYRDRHHLTATYARSIGPTLVKRVLAFA